MFPNQHSLKVKTYKCSKSSNTVSWFIVFLFRKQCYQASPPDHLKKKQASTFAISPCPGKPSVESETIAFCKCEKNNTEYLEEHRKIIAEK